MLGHFCRARLIVCAADANVDLFLEKYYSVAEK
jgi:hypothetical protein